MSTGPSCQRGALLYHLARQEWCKMKQAWPDPAGPRCSQGEDLESNAKVGLGKLLCGFGRALTTCFEEAVLSLRSFLQYTLARNVCNIASIF